MFFGNQLINNYFVCKAWMPLPEPSIGHDAMPLGHAEHVEAFGEHVQKVLQPECLPGVVMSGCTVSN